MQISASKRNELKNLALLRIFTEQCTEHNIFRCIVRNMSKNKITTKYLSKEEIDAIFEIEKELWLKYNSV